jgi:hypothetical protein
MKAVAVYYHTCILQIQTHAAVQLAKHAVQSSTNAVISPKFEGNEHAGHNPVATVEQDLNARGIARVVKDCFEGSPSLIVVRISGIANVPVVTSITV